MSSAETQATGLKALDEQILLAESRLVAREQLLRLQGRTVARRVGQGVMRHLGQGAFGLVSGLVIAWLFKARSPARPRRRAGLVPYLVGLLWPALPATLRSLVSPGTALTLLGLVPEWWARWRAPNKAPAAAVADK